MTDREMLELAAKAGGYEIVGIASRYITQGVGPDDLLIRNERGGDSVWNPLEYDGDALRLAVKLRLSISTPHPRHRAFVQSQDMRRGVMANDGDDALNDTDSYAATRRAIVRAAAEIGAKMA